MTASVATSGSSIMLAGSAASLGGTYAAGEPLHRIIAQETNLGLVRELVPPQDHIGLSILPWLEVPTDDVVFDYMRGSGTGMAPAHAEDAETTLWASEEFYSGRGSASVMDWALKNHYTASDIARYREMQKVIEMTNGRAGSLPLTVNSVIEGFQAKVARDTAERRRMLDNRVEWLITQALTRDTIEYNDGKIKFKVTYGRPADQKDQAPASGPYNGTEHDPINDILKVQEFMYERYGINMRRAIVSRKYLNSLYRSSKFVQMTGFLPSQGVDASDMPYLLNGWGPAAAIARVQAETGITFIENESVLRTQTPGTKNFVNTRYFPQDQVLFLPDESDIAAYDSTEMGFGKTLTAPHPMGNWTPGFYAWERETIDPWGQDIGTGVKAFPVLNHSELVYTQRITL